MKERPILFNGSMVRAILEGQKTQTRRFVKCDYEIVELATLDQWVRGLASNACFGRPITEADIEQKADQLKGRLHPAVTSDGNMIGLRCPYGQPGDRLWVRETWQGFRQTNYEYDEWEEMTSPKDWQHDHYVPVYKSDNKNFPDKWFPSIHMPRTASRIDLEITGVRVELLQDISEADAMAEGARRFDDIPMGIPSAHPNRWSMEIPTNTDQCLGSAKWAFANYFCKLGGNGQPDFSAWDANPWVWVIEFKVI